MAKYALVINQDRGSTVADRCRIAQGLVQRVLGLHIVPRLERGQGLLLPGASTIDTAFMRYPIDLVFLDRSGRVTRVVPDMGPWRMVLRTYGGRDCLELPAGAAAASGTQAGHVLAITPL